MKRRLAGLLAVSVAAALLTSVADASKAPSAMVKARQKFFGAGNVDPTTGAVRSDRVILSWFGVASHAASFNGHVVLIDAWIPRGSHSGYVPTDPEEVAALDPEYIFIGHGDFDHAADAAEIAALSGAPIVGTPEHCDSIRGQAPDADIDCVTVGPEGAPPGFTKQLPLLSGVGITAVVHIHSSFERPEQQDGGRLPCIPVWPVKDTVDHPPSPEDMQNLLEHLPDARGGNVLYQFRVGEFSLAWHDTTGKIAEDAPTAVKAIEALPETDVHSGSILAFGQVTNCFRSLGMYLDALSPKVFTPNHHDNFTYFLGANAKDLEPYVREEIGRIPKKDRPELLYTYDRTDYLNYKVLTFDPNDPRWR